MTARSDERTPYRLLGITPAASNDEVRRAYHRLARALHPDRFADAGPGERRLAERRMREVNRAWSILGDPVTRARYDEDSRLRAGVAGGSRGFAPSEDAVRRHAPERSGAGSRREEPDIPDLDGGGDDDELDDVELSPLHAFILRRVPVILALAVALAIFIGTAYAGSGAREPVDRPTTTCIVAAAGGC